MSKLYVRMSLLTPPLLQPLPLRSPQDARFMTRHDLRRDLIPLVTRPRSFDSSSQQPRFFVVTRYPPRRSDSAILADEERASEILQHLQLSSEESARPARGAAASRPLPTSLGARTPRHVSHKRLGDLTRTTLIELDRRRRILCRTPRVSTERGKWGEQKPID